MTYSKYGLVPAENPEERYNPHMSTSRAIEKICEEFQKHDPGDKVMIIWADIADVIPQLRVFKENYMHKVEEQTYKRLSTLQEEESSLEKVIQANGDVFLLFGIATENADYLARRVYKETRQSPSEADRNWSILYDDSTGKIVSSLRQENDNAREIIKNDIRLNVSWIEIPIPEMISEDYMSDLIDLLSGVYKQGAKMSPTKTYGKELDDPQLELKRIRSRPDIPLNKKLGMAIPPQIPKQKDEIYEELDDSYIEDITQPLPLMNQKRTSVAPEYENWFKEE